MSKEVGPIYGVELIKTLPLSGGMTQAMPSRKDLEAARIRSERAAAGYEVLLGHFNEALILLDSAVAEIHDQRNEVRDEIQVFLLKLKGGAK